MYDPDLSNTGHQPAYFDQLTQIYSRYVVVGASIMVQVVCASTTAALKFVIAYSDQDIGSWAVDEISESKYAKSAVVGNSNGMSTKTIQLPFITMSQLMGQREIESDPNMYSTVTIGPSDSAFCNFKAQAVDGVSSLAGYARFTLLMKGVMKDLKYPGPSIMRAHTYPKQGRRRSGV